MQYLNIKSHWNSEPRLSKVTQSIEKQEKIIKNTERNIRRSPCMTVNYEQSLPRRSIDLCNRNVVLQIDIKNTTD